MNLHQQHVRALTRRHFFKQCQLGLGSMALGGLLARESGAASSTAPGPLATKAPHFAPGPRT